MRDCADSMRASILTGFEVDSGVDGCREGRV